MNIIERDVIHKALDKFLDEVEKQPLSMEDGECHTFNLRGGGSGYNDSDELLVSFVVTTSKEEML